jgi:hypothetical protein
MNIRAAHGSKKNHLTQLEPQYIAGNNGSQDGIGINLTSDIGLAKYYAGSEGSVYLVDLNVDSYLTISDKTLLTSSQADVLKSELEKLPEKIQYRLATDICSKKPHTYGNDKEAEAFYEENKKFISSLDLGLDRMKPSIDYDDLGQMVILIAHKDFSTLETVNTGHIHRCLNLFNNEIATTLLKSISKGLILERESGLDTYLSFQMQETIVATLDGVFLKKPNAKELISESCKKYSTHTKERRFDAELFEP